MTDELRELKKISLVVQPGVTVAVWPLFNGKEEVINFSDVATFNGTYCSNNGTLAFVSENELFVTPFSTRKVFKNLNEAGFVERFFFVPFSNGEFPRDEKCIWEGFKTLAEKEFAKEFSQDCMEYAESIGIKALDESVLESCFCMPENGVKVKHFNYEERYFPLLSRLLDSYAEELIGKYCYNNGRVVFVNVDGKTYVARGTGIIKHLKEAGFTEKGLFVPFSNGEKIVNQVLAEKWENCQKI